MRPKNYYEVPIGPKDSDIPSLKVKSINSRINIIREAIEASIIQGTQGSLNLCASASSCLQTKIDLTFLNNQDYESITIKL